MGIYSKFIVAVIMMVALFLKSWLRIDWDPSEADLYTWVDLGIALLTPLFVRQIPNKSL